MAALTLGERPIESNVHQTAWFPYALFLGLIFIVGFNVVALTFQKFGVTLTTIMQKMSLILTVPIAIVMYDENVNVWKVIGLLAGLLSIYLTNLPQKDDYLNVKKLPKWMLILPVTVLLISVCIETILQYVQVRILGEAGGIKFTATLFLIAGTMGLVAVISGLITGRLRFSYKNIIAGMLLGIPNFFSIYLIMKAIEEGWEGSEFFPYNNISIIALSALIAYLFFNEKLSKVNVLGVLLAIAAIGLIALGA